MVDKYLQEDKELHQFLTNIVKNDKVSHAYLVEENDRDGFEFAKNLAKVFLCKNKMISLGSCDECSLCNLIDNNSYPELLVIEPDGINIKKEQLIDLQEKFSTQPIYNTKHICIIKNADRFNDSSANSVLKFLEEPDSPVIIFLICNNRHQVINTIVSRCQIITLKPLNAIDLLNGVDTEKTLIEKTIDIIKDFEMINAEVLIKYDIYQYKDELKKFLEIWLNFYMEVLDFKIQNNNSKNLQFIDEINYVCSRLSIDVIIKRIDVILSFIKLCEFNVNKDLFIDNFFISLERGEC